MLMFWNWELIEVELQKLEYLQTDDVRDISLEMKDKLTKSLEEEQGSIVPILVWIKDEHYYIIDGHGRIKIFREKYEPTYKVQCLGTREKTLEDVKRAIVKLSSHYQEWKTENIGDWLGDEFNMDYLDNLGDTGFDIENLFKDEDAIETQSQLEEESIWGLKDGMVFERYKNKYDIPIIKYEHCFLGLPSKEYTCWIDDSVNSQYNLFLHGVSSKKATVTDKKNGILSFYCWDDRLEGIWTKLLFHTEKLMKETYSVVITPNFSLFGDDPIAVQLWQLYRSRYVGRYFGEAGIKLIPDIQWTDERSLEWFLMGLPEKIGIAMQVQNMVLKTEQERKWFRDGWLEINKQIKPLWILVYGTQAKRDYINKLASETQSNVIWVEARVNRNRTRMKVND